MARASSCGASSARMFGRSHRLNRGAELSGSLRINAGGEQRRRKHRRGRRPIPPGRSRPDRARRRSTGPPLGAATSWVAPFSSTVAPVCCGPGTDRSDRILLDPATLTPEQPGQLTGMRGQQPAGRSRFGQIAEPVGIDAPRAALLGHLCQHLGAVGTVAPARAEQMRLDPPVREHHVRQLGRDGRRRPLGAQKSDHTGAAVDRAVDRHHRGTWVLLGAGVDADHPAGVLVAALGRIGPRARQVVLIQADQVGCLVMVSAESDIDHRDRAAAAQRRLQQVARFPLAEGDRLSCSDRGARARRRCRLSTPEGRSTAMVGMPWASTDLHKAGNRVRQSWTAADAEDSVDDQVVRASDRRHDDHRGRQLGHLRAARRPARPRCGSPRAADGCDPGARAGPAVRRRTARRRRCCPAPTMIITRRPYRPPLVDVEQVGRAGGDGRCGPLHQRRRRPRRRWPAPRSAGSCRPGTRA